MSSNTLADAIQQLLRFEKLVWDLGISEFKQGDLTSSIQLKTLLPDIIPSQLIELAIAGWISFGRDILASQALKDQPDLPIKIHFKHKAPKDTSEHLSFFACPVLFEQKENAVIIPNSLLNEKTRDSDPHLKQMMSRKGESLLNSYHSEANLCNEVRAIICQQLSQGEPEIEMIALQLGTTSRRLRKRLQEVRTSFKSLLDEVRYELAQAYLMDSQLNLVDVAFMLGFSEQSAFSRAFKRWHGSTPSQFRGNDFY